MTAPSFRSDVLQDQFQRDSSALWLPPRCSRFPGPKSVLILDNASVYHTQVSDVDVDVELRPANYQ